MPTVLNVFGYRFFFYSNDHDPPHIHVEKGNATAKFLLRPIELVKSKGFGAKDLKEIRKFIELYQLTLERSWNEYFDNK
ncbi:hypothetical protein C943_03440 [Mariniradius saccharolyticus AK6]|jgi:hypothetical protein|uniref:DUF4160 domain-containing protein n=1 Tax=Mariniradius saccharolyticus AK6 TaxID=1239962 RepID=M7XJN2_9BACT|nr:DUF4160 domain-containing protein [Mariniradius saccharolyticus]EMS34753.1 hypothetical protein C943_03440 [Mariniradius saccharolyticus AK6]